MKTPVILVIDGQGGGIGKKLVEEILKQMPQDMFHYTLLVCGTNSLATQAMLKAGAHAGATGEAAIIYQAGKADFILGPAGILAAHSLMGELSPAMASAIGASEACKYVVPMNLCRIRIAEASQTLPPRIEACVHLMVQDYKVAARSGGHSCCGG